MIQVAAFLPGRCTTGFAELAINGHEIDDRPPSAKLDQANFVLTSLDRAAQRSAVKVKHCFEVNNAQHKVINVANVEHACSQRVAG